MALFFCFSLLSKLLADILIDELFIQHRCRLNYRIAAVIVIVVVAICVSTSLCLWRRG